MFPIKLKEGLKMDEKLMSEYIKHNLIYVSVMLIIILAGIIGYKFFTREKAPDTDSWNGAEFGDIVVNMEEDEKEEIPDNIFDAYGLEYEYTKIPSFGIYTYKPVCWEILYDNDFFYFISPEDDEDYPHVEIALCTVNIGSINNVYDRTFAQNYVQTNIKNHNTTELAAKLITNNDYIAIKDGGDLFAYYAKPSIEYRRMDDAAKGGWNPYSVFYMLNVDDDITTFCCVSGPKMLVDNIEEIAKTLAYNTARYENTKFDYNELMNVKMTRRSMDDMTYLVKEKVVETINYDGKYDLSDNISSLAFNVKLVVRQEALDGDIEDFVDYDFMKSLFSITSPVYHEYESDFSRKGLENPTFSVDSIEKREIAGKDARKVVWRAEIDNDSTGRTRTDSIMPKMFTTYIIHNNKDVYSFTINYTKYQKYAANEYIDKTMETVGFND